MDLRKIVILLIIGFSGFSYLYSQDESLDDMKFDETETTEEANTYFSLGGGYIADFGFFNFDDLNSKLKTMNLGLDDLKSPVFMQGAHGFTGGLGMLGMDFLNNVRIGFIGIGGSAQSETTFGDTTHGFEYDIGMTGLSLDYGFVPFKTLAVLVGVTGGWGNIKLEAYKTSKNTKWDDFTPANTVNNYFQRTEASFWFVRPNLYIEYAVLPYMMVRANVGYNFTFINDWTMNRTVTLEKKTVPDTINGNGLSVQIGLFFGLFTY